ncbi:MAG TPA: hypothetical protein GXZ91_05490 [Christensenellaceae bacterium]|nr:hypothetical protein [Christensenellaceae bacterium]
MQNKPLNTLFRQEDLSLWNDFIPMRYSVRHFLDNTSIDNINVLEYSLAKYNLSGARIVLKRNEQSKNVMVNLPLFPKFENVFHYACVITDYSVPLSKFYAGILGEAFVLNASSLGLGTCWVAGNFRRSVCDVKLADGERIQAIIPYGKPLGNTKKKGRKPLNALCKSNPSAWPLWAYRAADAVRIAPSAVNLQPWRFDFTGSTLCIKFRFLNSLDAGIACLHAIASLNNMAFECFIDEKDNSLRFFVER